MVKSSVECEVEAGRQRGVLVMAGQALFGWDNNRQYAGILDP